MDEQAIMEKVRGKLDNLDNRDLTIALEVVSRHPVATAAYVTAVSAHSEENNRKRFYGDVIGALSVLLAAGFIQLKTID